MGTRLETEIENFVKAVGKDEIEIYNEFSVQHELGIFLRERLGEKYKIQFERNVKDLFGEEKKGKFIKKEIDITIFDKSSGKPNYAIELKFPRNRQYPEQMYSFYKDIKFTEQLKAEGISETFVLIIVDDPGFYDTGSKEGIYQYFRGNEKPALPKKIDKPTGKKDPKKQIGLKSSSYKIEWKTIALNDKIRYTLIKAE
jgi:hypothetical protein